MRVDDVVALLALFAIVAYGVLGGADFGGGVWDALARGPRAREQRTAIAHAMGPVWEANHVWLIFLLVILFTAFPPAYAALSVALYWPFHLALLGITLRGASFIFRGQARDVDHGEGRAWGSVFGGASVVTPFVFGVCLGAVSSDANRVLAPMPIVTGLLAVAICAYLAAVYLANETEGDLREDFRRRALVAGTIVVALSAIAVPLTRVVARPFWEGLVGERGAPIVAIGIVCTLVSGWAIRSRRYRLARAAAIAQVAWLLCGWGAAQYPFVIRAGTESLDLASSAAPRVTLVFVLWTLPLAVCLVLPATALLFSVFKGGAANEQKARDSGK